MSKEQTAIKSKLFKLKKWLTVPEAARHLSILFSEEVSEADVLRLALDSHLKLSVNFVNHAKARRGKVVPYEDAEWYPPNFFPKLPNLPDEAKGKPVRVMKSLNIDGERFLNLGDKVITLKGVWDLSMVGNECLDVEHEYQQLTDGPVVTLTCLDGAFVERENGQMCQLQDRFDEDELCQVEQKFIAAGANIKSHHAERKKKPYEHPDNYYPAGTLPRNSVLVVRTQALIDLQESLSSEESTKDANLGTQAATPSLTRDMTFMQKNLK